MIPRRTGFAQKVGQSDPLPPTAAVPLCKGDNKPSYINECSLPLEKGESRVAAGGRSPGLVVPSRCEATVSHEPVVTLATLVNHRLLSWHPFRGGEPPSRQYREAPGS